MKKWNNPKLMMLGLENTNEINEIANGGLPDDNNGNQHYCHYYNEFHTNNCTSYNPDNNGHTHTQSGNCKDGVHWNESHKSKCCCAGLS